MTHTIMTNVTYICQDTDSADSVSRLELEDYLVSCWKDAMAYAAENAASASEEEEEKGGAAGESYVESSSGDDAAGAGGGGGGAVSSSSPPRSAARGGGWRRAYEPDYGPAATPEQQRIMELEEQARRSAEEVDALRRQLLSSQRANELLATAEAPLNPEKENTIYSVSEGGKKI